VIRKPMKAPSNGATLDELKALHYPIACSPKLDGIRGIITPAGVLSNSLKPLGNTYMQRQLTSPLFSGLDGEIVVGLPYKDLLLPDDDVFNRTTGAIRRSKGEPAFTFWAFDDFTNVNQRYDTRWIQSDRPTRIHLMKHPHIKILKQRICNTWQDAIAYEEELLEMGYEGMMPRTLSGHYKEGRATAREGLILKRKPLAQDEAIVVGLFEQMKNNNEKAVNEMGNSFRTAHKENKEGKGTLGGVVLKSPRWKETFNCGTIIGGTIEWRQKMWDNPDLIIGQTMTYVYQEYGSIDKPRQPRAKAEFRLSEDL